MDECLLVSFRILNFNRVLYEHRMHASDGAWISAVGDVYSLNGRHSICEEGAQWHAWAGKKDETRMLVPRILLVRLGCKRFFEKRCHVADFKAQLLTCPPPLYNRVAKLQGLQHGFKRTCKNPAGWRSTIRRGEKRVYSHFLIMPCYCHDEANYISNFDGDFRKRCLNSHSLFVCHIRQNPPFTNSPGRNIIVACHMLSVAILC